MLLVEWHNSNWMVRCACLCRSRRQLQTVPNLCVHGARCVWSYTATTAGCSRLLGVTCTCVSPSTPRYALEQAVVGALCCGGWSFWFSAAVCWALAIQQQGHGWAQAVAWDAILFRGLQQSCPVASQAQCCAAAAAVVATSCCWQQEQGRFGSVADQCNSGACRRL
jgi:hypothetical protein